jgi:hypothetical protein
MCHETIFYNESVVSIRIKNFLVVYTTLFNYVIILPFIFKIGVKNWNYN